MNEQKVLRCWRIASMTIYFLAGFMVWFAANAWIFGEMNHRAIEAVNNRVEERTTAEARDIKWETP